MIVKRLESLNGYDLFYIYLYFVTLKYNLSCVYLYIYIYIYIFKLYSYDKLYMRNSVYIKLKTR